MFLGSLIPKKFLGIDIGTSLIKIVELSRWRDRKKLENYGEISASVLYNKSFRTFEKSTLVLSDQEVAKAISAIMEEAKIQARDALLTIPDFSSFFTNFELPPMTAEEIPEAIRSEAKQYVPLPLAELALDWQVVGGVPNDKKTKLKVLLVAVPSEVINQYQKIAQLAGLQLKALEAEVFALVRALVPEEEKRAVALIDIGAQSTTCNIIEKRILKFSHSFDLGGNELTKRLSEGLSIDYKKSEDIKKKYGILSSPQTDLESEMSGGQILFPLIDFMIKEAEKIIKNFYWTEGKEIDKIILAGGAALLPGLLEYFRDHFKKEVEIINPFSAVFCPPILEKKLKGMGPSYAVAVGAALRGLEY